MLYLMEFDVCSNPQTLRIIYLVLTVIKVLFMAVPIILILMLMITLVKTMVTGEDTLTEGLKSSVNKIVACFLVFLTPTIVSLLTNSVLNLGVSYNSCASMLNLDQINYLSENERKLKEEEKAERAREEAERAEELAIQRAEEIKNNQNLNSDTGHNIGQKYDLTDEQLLHLTRVCLRENGYEIDAIKATASQMANRYELYGKPGETLYTHVRDGAWWGGRNGATFTNTRFQPNAEQLAAAKEVFVLGKRTLPGYIDEHGCVKCSANRWDVMFIDTNGTRYYSPSNEVLNRSNWVRDVTKVYTRYGKGKDYYTFYTYPTSKTDPFGYTPWGKRKYDKLNGGS